MNTITVKAVTNKKDFKEFLYFPYKLFKDDKKWVPSLIMDEKTTFNKKKNPALEFCDFKIFLAYKDSEVVGRVVGMINHKSNEIWKEKRIRFGWLDFINEEAVCQKLLEAVENWGRSEGMTEIVGPMGFTDMDKEGMLVEGFEEDCTMATYYNPSYYPQIIERLSYKKEVDWIQYRIKANQEIPEKILRINNLIKEKYNLRIVEGLSAKQIAKRYGHKLFDTLNESFSDLFGYVPLNEKQAQFYIDMYFPFLDKRLLCLIVDENDDIAAFGVSMPSLTEALRKSKGKLFPFGWYHLLKAIRNFENIDLYFNGVHPKWQNKGIHSIYYAEMNKQYINIGSKTAIANPQLETNLAARIWEKYEESNIAMRRRAYIKEIPEDTREKVLVTGASGFIGSTLIDQLLEEGKYNVYAGIRSTSSRKYLTDSRISFIDLPYSNPEKLKEILSVHKFKCIFHFAGLTKAKRNEDFERVNYKFTKNLVDAIDVNQTKLIYLSSFAAHGPGDEKTFAKAKVSDVNKPNTAYGVSKLKSEEYINANFKGKYVILRPTGVYGPRETDYFVFSQTIKNHLEPYLGFVPQHLTFVYSKDLVDLCIKAFESEVSGKTYFVSDGNMYLDSEYARISKETLRTWTIKIKFPLCIVKFISSFLDSFGKIIGKQFTLNKDKYSILSARNWDCDIEDLKKDLDYCPQYDLKKGVEESIKWYKNEKWL